MMFIIANPAFPRVAYLSNVAITWTLVFDDSQAIPHYYPRVLNRWLVIADHDGFVQCLQNYDSTN